MYAAIDPQVALNNQTIFMLARRADGRLPGMVVPGARTAEEGWDAKGFPPGYVPLPAHGLVADYEMLQGYCFPEPAWRMYFWSGRDRRYLEDLHATLKGHDEYLWRTRDSNGDGLLETWCVWDTGEDGSTRLNRRGARDNWPFEQAPGSGAPGIPESPADSRMPFQSMDVMAYSYTGRATLAKVSRELGNGEEEKWTAAAAEVRRRVIEKMWNPERHACFDLDRDGRPLDELIHNNLRCMWSGLFTQEMADAFIRHHLLNPDEFWTPVPLVSIALNEPLFFSGPRNNWSGQPQGLTYQRAIGALENYGHHAEVTLLGRKLLPVLVRNGGVFSQQLDPDTGEPSLSNRDGYGPMILAMRGYLARMHGIHLDVEHDRVWWSGLDGGGESFTWRQRWGDREFRLVAADGRFSAEVNGRARFQCTLGTRVVSDLDGNPVSVVGISPQTETVEIIRDGVRRTAEVRPNHVLALGPDGLSPASAVPFDHPARPPAAAPRGVRSPPAPK